MSLEKGGRTDKFGNQYELLWSVNKILDVIEEQVKSIVIEPIGVDEKGVDITIYHKNGEKEFQQCKRRNTTSEIWTIHTLYSKK